MKLPAHAIIIALFLAAIGELQGASDPMKDPNFKKAVTYFFQQKFSMAELLLQEVIRSDPENHLAYSYLGDIFLYKKEYDGALRLYQKAVDLSPSSADNFFRIGQIYYKKKIGNLAIDNYKKAMELDGKMKISIYQIGLTYLMILRDKKNTVSNWEDYLRQSPEDPQYESIRRVIELLKDPNFQIPPEGSDVSIEEALLLGGATLQKVERKASDRQEGHEKLKSGSKVEGLLNDDL